jgi:hypothetical protein
MIVILNKVGWYLTTLTVGAWLQVTVVEKDIDQWNLLYQNCPHNYCGKHQDLNISDHFYQTPPFKEGDIIFIHRGAKVECQNAKKVEEHDLPFWISRNSYICNLIEGEITYYDEKGKAYTIKQQSNN